MRLIAMLQRIMKREGTVRLFAFAVAAILLTAPAAAGKPTIFKCELKSGVISTEDGNLEQQAPGWIKQFNPMIIDVVSGVVRTGKRSEASRWKIVVQGDDRNDWVLRKEWKTPGGLDVGVIRVRDWKNDSSWKGGPLVIYHEADTLSTGTCKRLD